MRLGCRLLVKGTAHSVGLVVRFGYCLLVNSSAHSVGFVARRGLGLKGVSSSRSVVVSLWEFGKLGPNQNAQPFCFEAVVGDFFSMASNFWPLRELARR